jgi:hypothetical protein
VWKCHLLGLCLLLVFLLLLLLNTILLTVAARCFFPGCCFVRPWQWRGRWLACFLRLLRRLQGRLPLLLRLLA